MNALITLYQTSILDKRSNVDVQLTINNFDVLRYIVPDPLCLHDPIYIYTC
jgi:hypothetical protein